MRNIYQISLDDKFLTIKKTIGKAMGYGDGLNGLTAEQQSIVETLAEQAVMNWAVARNQPPTGRPPVTNLQHLLNDYCALADHL